MIATRIEGCKIGDLVTVVVRVSDYYAVRSIQFLYVTVTVANCEDYLSAIGIDSPFKNAKFILAGNDTRYLRDHIILLEAGFKNLARFVIYLV